MILQNTRQPLQLVNLDIPKMGNDGVLIKVLACGICRTDLHLIDGELPNIQLPIIPGHEIVGEVVDKGETIPLEIGTLVGIPWLGWTCGACRYCQAGMENLCDHAKFTGYQLNGGFSEYTVANHRFCLPLEISTNPVNIAPLLCAGLIGYRSYKITKNVKGPLQKIGIYGFGAAAHILIQIMRHEGLSCYAFTRSNDLTTQKFAVELGACWAGDADSMPPEQLDAAIIFAPVGNLIPVSLQAVRKGGIVVCGGIHMSDIPSFPYELLWGERTVCSVANLTRKDGLEFLRLLKDVPIKTHVKTYPLEEANVAIDNLRAGRINGAAVLTMK